MPFGIDGLRGPYYFDCAKLSWKCENYETSYLGYYVMLPMESNGFARLIVLSIYILISELITNDQAALYERHDEKH